MIFAWGEKIDGFDLNLDGEVLRIVKYHPWKSKGCQVLTGQPDTDVINFHCAELRASYYSIYEVVIAWIAYKKLGLNQHALVSGVCRALGCV